MSRLITAYIFTLLFLVPQTFTQERRVDEPISDELYEAVAKRAEAIEREVSSTTTNKWFGTYMDGDHHPTVFRWSANSGYVVTSSRHTFSPSWVNFGKVNLDNNLLTIFPELSKGHMSAHIMPVEYRLVGWDTWRILVPTDQLLEFAYAVHSRSESQIWRYFIKSGSSEGSRKGLPDLPAKYFKYMKMSAIKTRIIGIEGRDEEVWESKITIDAGSRRNVISGMEFYYSNKSGIMIRIRVDKVNDNSSTAYLSMLGSGGETANENIGPKVGMTFTSRVPKGFGEP